jgi:hypothetical protein
MYFESLKSVGNISFNKHAIQEPSNAQKDNDGQFLIDFVLKCHENNRGLASIPNLVDQARRARNQQDFEIYSEKTCVEFHRLFIELLGRFHMSLQALSSSQNQKLDLGALSAAITYGHVLQGLAKGSALQLHLMNIEPLLQRKHPDNQAPALHEEEKDEDLEAVRPSAVQGGSKSLWESYWDWFRLVMVHFQAVDILAESING